VQALTLPRSDRGGGYHHSHDCDDDDYLVRNQYEYRATGRKPPASAVRSAECDNRISNDEQRTQRGQDAAQRVRAQQIEQDGDSPKGEIRSVNMQSKPQMLWIVPVGPLRPFLSYLRSGLEARAKV
jgi:hypothetical protein